MSPRPHLRQLTDSELAAQFAAHPWSRAIQAERGHRDQMATTAALWPPEPIRAAARPKVPMPPLHAPGDEPKGIVAPLVACVVLAVPVALAVGGGGSCGTKPSGCGAAAERSASPPARSATVAPVAEPDEIAAAELAAELAFDHLAGLMGLDGGDIKHHLADLLGAEADRLRDVAEGGDGGPVALSDYGGHGCDAGEEPVIAVFSTRELADRAVAEYQAAMDAAVADGHSWARFHGDRFVVPDRTAVPLDPPSLRAYVVGQHHYLGAYWPEPDQEPVSQGRQRPGLPDTQETP